MKGEGQGEGQGLRRVLQAAPITRWEQLSEELWQRGVGRRMMALQQLINQPFTLWDVAKGRYIWDWFSPDFVCPNMERIGRLGDGGKWVCELDQGLEEEKPCVVYSFGARDDVTFEQEIIQRTGGQCEVHVFDPSVGGLPQYAHQESKLTWHKAALAAHSGPDKLWPVSNSLHGHMSVLGHTHLSLLKVDCEGCEWAVFEALIEGGLSLPFSQLSIELHLDNFTDHETSRSNMFKLFEGLEAQGFRAFAREVNIGPTLTGGLPVACEYSFIKNAALQLPPSRPVQKALTLTPPSLKAAIYVLVNSKRLSQLTMMLQQLHKNFNRKYRYPIVLFHEGDLTPEDRSAITQQGDWSWIRFEQIELSLAALEPGIDPQSIPEETECGPKQISYRHMCRFHSIEASERLSKLGYEWHWRLDDDSRLPEEVGYDVFEMMSTNKLLYGYIDIVQEEKKCYTTLWDLAELHLAHTQAEPSFYYSWPEGVVFYNNFEISHRSIWEMPQVQGWMKAIRESRGIYTHRWGDAPIRTLAVSMFVPQKKVHRFSDLGYSHLPLFKQSAGTLPALGLGVVQSALCSHIHWWTFGENASTLASTRYGCNPLLDSRQLRFHLPSDEITAAVKQLGEGMVSTCSPPHLSHDTHSRCDLRVEAQNHTGFTHTSTLAQFQLSTQPAPELQKLLGIHKQGMLGSDVAVSIQLPSNSNSSNNRTLWLLGDTPWGSYDEQACARETKTMPRNMLAVSENSETCFHFRQDSDLMPLDLMAPFFKPDLENYQHHWRWMFNGLVLEGKLYILGADFWLAPHTMWVSQGTLVWVIHNPEDPIHDWRYTTSYLNKHLELHWYAGIAQHGEHVYLSGSLEDTRNQVTITTKHGLEVEKGLVFSRIKSQHFSNLAWDQIEYWDGEGWNPQTAADIRDQALPILGPVLRHTGGGETTLAWDPTLQLWYMLFVSQVDSHWILLHYATTPEGPWSAVKLYQPPSPFTDTSRFMCYAAKSHPGLASGPEELVISYVCTKRPWTWPGHTNVYTPQFLRVRLTRSPTAQVLVLSQEAVTVGDEILHEVE
eukprot:TRINITY_DN3687_c0_g5_i5.p1 TRINITY_DN3687_c0_g5~~TRINITY_DN3687_c0_g5_i5.p1  ORF type:complete len:1054 (+),score=180.25 TRINITY_DN3687_c0_g5_i5:410-3571(+)